MATVLHPRILRGFLAATVVTTLLCLTLPLADRAQGETVTPSCPAAPVVLSNDSFESPVVDAKERKTVDGSVVTGWIGTGEKGKVTLLANGWTDINAAVGRQFAQLSGTPARLSQDVATVPGTSLAWALSHRAVNGSASMRVLIGAPGSNGTEQSVVTDATTWTRHNGTYKVPDGQTITRITLLPVDGSAPDANLVDEVSLGTASCVTASVSQTPTTPVAVEGVITQTAAIKNTGGSPTNDVLLGVTLSKTVEYVDNSSKPAGTYGVVPDTLLIRPVGTLGVPGVILPTETVVVSWQERVLPAASDSVITIPASVTAVDAFNVKTATPDDNTTVVVSPSSDIQVSQQFTPALVASGGTTTLSFTATNDGPSNASGVSIVEELPVGLTAAGATPAGCVLAGRTLTCTVGALANGDSRTWEMPLTAPSTASPLVVRSALIARANGTDPSGDNNRTVESLSIAPPAPPTLEANVSPTPLIGTAGAVATVAVDVMNVGSAAGTAPLVVGSAFPAGFTPLFVVGTPPPGAAAPTCSASPAQCTFPGMAAGASARVEFRGVLASDLADGSSFTANVQTSGIGAAAVTSPVVFSINAQSTLAVDERIAGPISAGSPITKLVTVVDGGPSMAREASVFIPLPKDATPFDTPTNCSPAFGGLVCTLGDIDEGAFVSTEISFQLPNTGGTIADGARAGTTTPMPNPVVDRNTNTTVIGPVADLFVKVTGMNPATDIGDAVSFTIDVTNRGPGDASAVQVLSDPKLTGLRFDSALAERGVWNANLALWEIPTLASGATARLRVEATGTRTSSTALSVFARSDNPDIAAIDNTAIAPLDVLAAAAPETKSSGSGWLMPVLLGIGALIFIIACAYLFLQRRKNKS
jgi:uncharacterized repeat protein (TIGR01451 family)